MTDINIEQTRLRMLGNKCAKGLTFSEKALEKMRQASTGRITSDETKTKQREAMIGNKNALGYIHSKETLEKMSRAQIGERGSNWKGGMLGILCDYCGNIIERHPSEIRPHNFCCIECCINYSGFNKSNTKIEVLMQEVLTDAGYNFETQIPILSYFPDILLTDYDIIIECDGNYWHCNPDIYPIPINDIQRKVLRTDSIRDKKLMEEGYTVLRFWECDIENNIEECLQTIRDQVNLLEH